MSQAIFFDTLAYAKKLTAAGVAQPQAEAQAETLASVFEERVATKQDIEGLKKDIDVKFSQVDIKFAELKSSLIMWVIGIVAGQSALIITAMKFLH